MRKGKCSKWYCKDKSVNEIREHTRTRILVECSALIASVRVGVLDVLRPFEERGVCEVAFVKTMEIKAKHIKWCDILVIVRGCELATVEIARVAKKYGRFIIYYLDDDLLNVPVENEDERLYYSQIVKNNLPKVIALSDCLWGVNKNIKERYIELCSTRRWVENRVPAQLVDIEKENKEVVKILFAGSSGHQMLFREVLTPVIQEMAEKYNGTLDFTCMGIDSGIDNMINVHNVEYIADYDQYRAFVEKGNFDIGLAIIRDLPFYRCKYYNKFLEYTSIGCVGIYTDAEPYTFVIENGKNGYLCKNTYEGWKRAIELAVFDSKKRISCLENARKQLQRDYNIESIVEDLAAAVPEFINYRAPEVKWHQYRIIIPKWIYMMDRIRSLYKQYGFYKGSLAFVCKVIRKIV